MKNKVNETLPVKSMNLNSESQPVKYNEYEPTDSLNNSQVNVNVQVESVVKSEQQIKQENPKETAKAAVAVVSFEKTPIMEIERKKDTKMALN